jgi:hypothetical protein
MHTPNDPSDKNGSSGAQENEPPMELDWDDLESAFDELEAGNFAESSAAS